jgi:hypothetical protein
MCTVTFIPKSTDGFILTSNRDEAPGRVTLPPEIYSLSETNVLFPKDAVAGGTWIGVSDKKRLICLLNGGFKAHERKESYRMSRGIIVTNLLTSKNALQVIETYNFSGIEPFTIILVDWSKELQLYELVWDGFQSLITEKPLGPQIWSSSLLYSEATKKKRISWFSEFLFANSNPNEAELLHFHKTTGDGNSQTDLIIDRGFVKTKSITQIVHSSNTSMLYEDLENDHITKISL